MQNEEAAAARQEAIRILRWKANEEVAEAAANAQQQQQMQHAAADAAAADAAQG